MTSTTTTPTEVMAHALLDLAAAGRWTPCQVDPAAFTSEERETRAEAAVACCWCPVLEPCRAAADHRREDWHVWGGVDRTRDNRPPRRRHTPRPDQETAR